MVDIEVTLPPGPEAPAFARDAIRRLERAVVPPVRGDLLLLTSEVVTNAVRHADLQAGDRIRLRASASEERVRVEVTDPGGGGVPEVGPPREGGRGGWGLLLVSHLAARWGVERGPGTTVWFELHPPESRFDAAADRVDAQEGPPNGVATRGGSDMDEKFEDAKGRVKEAAGDLTDNDDLKREGKIDQAAAKVKEKTDQAVDKVKEKVEEVRDS